MLKVKLLSPSATIPARKTEQAAGHDLFSNEDVTIPPWSQVSIGTGIAICPPSGSYARIAPRSSLAAIGIMCLAGVCDADFRGEIRCVLYNSSNSPYHVKRDDRCAQLIIEKIYMPDIELVENLPGSARGEGGFGSTGK